jgi:hypothetical protein
VSSNIESRHGSETIVVLGAWLSHLPNYSLRF